MKYANFFLSSGRCGTQWLSTNLQACYSDVAVVTHEPILRNYTPRFLLGSKDPGKAPFAQVILEHAAAIERWIETADYLECGWPCYAALEFFAARLPGRVRILHLVRHPIPTAVSMLTHSYYRDDVTNTVNHYALLRPSDAGVSLRSYRDRWADMTRLEKCLYFWAEVNLLGLRLERQLGVPFLRLKSEDLFHADGLDRLLDFFGLPRRDAIYAARSIAVDRWRHYTSAEIDPSSIAKHPEIMAVAKQLGYDPLDVELQSLRDRYEESPERKTKLRKDQRRQVDISGREIESPAAQPASAPKKNDGR